MGTSRRQFLKGAGAVTAVSTVGGFPLVARAQVRILEEGVADRSNVPGDLAPRLPFSPEQIRAGLPERGPFAYRDLRCYATVPR